MNNKNSLLTFIIPSLFGILLFMTPISFNGEITIPIAILAGSFRELISHYIPYIVTFIIVVAATMSIVAKIITFQNNFLNNLFNVNIAWLLARVLGAIFAVMTLFQLGPEWIWSTDTGGMVLFDLLPVLFSIFLFAGLLLPLLLNFGLLELCGALFSKIMRPLFKLPGRSAVNCTTSWLGDGTIGVLLTSKQYEEGFYTKREAAIIGTSFSVVSITFSLVIISQVGLGSMFIPFYVTVTLAGIIAAIIMPRIPPLSRKPDTYYNNNRHVEHDESIPKGYTPFSWGLHLAKERASKSAGIKDFLKGGFENVLDLWIGVTPVVMAMGTIALMIAVFTPIFKYLGVPFVPILELMQIPEAQAASETILIGFADMFLPSVLATGIESEMTRFIVAALSVTQLIYMSEVGGILLGSKIPISFKDLFIIFIQRTIITLPIITLVAHMIF